MSLPAFTPDGDLPVGVHKATLGEVLDRFGTRGARREAVGQRLERIFSLAASTRQVARFIVFGSFVTEKLEPNDVDVFLLMDDSFDVSSVVGEARFVFDHVVAQSRLGASVFWLRRATAMGGEAMAVEDWQRKRDGSRRGIVDVTGR